MRRAVVPALAAGVLLLAGCGGTSGGTPGPVDAGATGSPSGTSTTATPTADPTADPTTASPSGATGAVDGSPEDPVAVRPVDRPLAWRDLPGRVVDTVTTNGRWTLTLDESGTTATLAGPGGDRSFTAGRGRRFGDGLLDDDHAVLVAQDPREQAPAVATVVDLAGGATWRVDGRSDAPTTSGGSWTLAGDTLLHPTLDAGRYCLARVDLADRSSSVGFCAPPRSGFNSPIVTDAGIGLLTFDDSRPSCRTAVTITGDSGAVADPLPGVAECAAWQGLPTADGAVWSTIPQPRRVEHAAYAARTATGWYDLGPGVSGTLTWCAGSAFFSRDPDGAAEPAALMRWDGTTLTTAFTAPRGQSFVAEPRCAGSWLSISVLGEGGDQQVAAPVS